MDKEIVFSVYTLGNPFHVGDKGNLCVGSCSKHPKETIFAIVTYDFILRTSEGVLVPLYFLVLYLLRYFFAFCHEISLGGGFKNF